MNAPVLTRAADGFSRRAFTNSDILRMIESGVIDPDEHFELIQGEIVPMSPELSRHGKARMELTAIFIRALPREWLVATDLSLFLADDIELKPDLHIFSRRIPSADVRGPDVMLAVELSSTTQKRDLELKAPVYAKHGVSELWVIDLEARRGLIFDRIEGGAYRPGRSVGASDLISPGAFPAIALRIDDLF